MSFATSFAPSSLSYTPMPPVASNGTATAASTSSSIIPPLAASTHSTTTDITYPTITHPTPSSSSSVFFSSSASQLSSQSSNLLPAVTALSLAASSSGLSSHATSTFAAAPLPLPLAPAPSPSLGAAASPTYTATSYTYPTPATPAYSYGYGYGYNSNGKTTTSTLAPALDATKLQPPYPFIIRRMRRDDLPVVIPLNYYAFYEFNKSVGMADEFGDFAAVERIWLAELDRAARGLNVVNLVAVGIAAFPASTSVLDYYKHNEHTIVELDPPFGKYQEISIMGCCTFDYCDDIAFLGMVSVAQKYAGLGVGKKILKACLEIGSKANVRSTRLVQISANVKAFSLYQSLGFHTKMSLVNLKGRLSESGVKHYLSSSATAAESLYKFTVRRMEEQDILLCDSLHVEWSGLRRFHQISDYQKWRTSTTWVVELDKNIVAYATSLGIAGHSVSRSVDALVALLIHVSTFQQTSLDLHVDCIRYGSLLQLLLELGLKSSRFVNLMCVGEFQANDSLIYCPSIEY